MEISEDHNTEVRGRDLKVAWNLQDGRVSDIMRGALSFARGVPAPNNIHSLLLLAEMRLTFLLN